MPAAAAAPAISGTFAFSAASASLLVPLPELPELLARFADPRFDLDLELGLAAVSPEELALVRVVFVVAIVITPVLQIPRRAPSRAIGPPRFGR
jgi:hypothetical protein